MIRNAVLHVANEQPLLADLFGVPAATDAGLLCTNLRMMDGKRPVFIDDIAATFFFPYRVIRFVEMPPGAMARHVADGGDAPASAARVDLATGDPGTRLPVPVGNPVGPGDPEPPADIELDLDIDEGFLQRVRDI
jgi:hypothetical protein